MAFNICMNPCPICGYFFTGCVVGFVVARLLKTGLAADEDEDDED